MTTTNTLLTPRGAAAHLAVTERTLAQWRWKGFGPAFVKLSGRAVRYQLDALIAWVATQVRTSTSDAGCALV